MKINLIVDGKRETVDADPAMPLLYALRDDLGFNNPKFGCGRAQCGACTVHVNGDATRSCVTPVGNAAGQEVTTLNGLGTPENPHPLQTAYVEEQVPQCGYCINGWMMTAAAFSRKSEAERRADPRGARRASNAAAARTWRSCAPSSARNADGLRET